MRSETSIRTVRGRLRMWCPWTSSTGAIMKAKRYRRSLWHVGICFNSTHSSGMWQCNRVRLVFHGWRGWGRPKKEGVVVIRFITCHSLSLLYHFFRILLHSLSYLDLFHRHNFQLIPSRNTLSDGRRRHCSYFSQFSRLPRWVE